MCVHSRVRMLSSEIWQPSSWCPVETWTQAWSHYGKRWEIDYCQFQHSSHSSSNLCVISPPLQFLLRVLTSWVQAIDDFSSSAPVTSSAPLPSCGPKADWWPSLCLELGSLLQVNPDILRRHIVCELYNQGLDLRAEEVIRELSL